MNQLTPLEEHGGIWCKRDDLFEVAGVRGGKARTCWHLAQGARGLVTAGSRQSPQVNIVAHVAKALGIPCRIHTPAGKPSPELISAMEAGAERVEQRPGYNNVIISRARKDANARGWMEIPFGMECWDAVWQTAEQVTNVLEDFKRLVITAGSGMSLAGVLRGMDQIFVEPLPVLAIMVGADPTKRLDKYAPWWWKNKVDLLPAGLDYHRCAKETLLGDLQLDPIYEAKCLPYLEPGDVFWVVGIRKTALG